MKDKWHKIVAFLLARLQEPSAYRGFILFISAGSWAKLDGSSKGEVIMQSGLMLLGLIQIFLPQDVLYKTSKPKEVWDK